jgi:hypothetical protein
MTISNTQLVFDKWKASLRSRDRSKKAMPENFDELFMDLKKIGTSFEEAHAFLPEAIKAHLPSPHVRRETYKKYKDHLGISEKEFIDEWNESIKSAATDAFFTNYPLKIDDDDDGEPKVFGNMSAREYRRQRQYSDSFPTLNTDDLEKQLKERKPLSDDLVNVLGGEDDDK